MKETYFKVECGQNSQTQLQMRFLIIGKQFKKRSDPGLKNGIPSCRMKQSVMNIAICTFFEANQKPTLE